MKTYSQETIFTFEDDGQTYRVDRASGDVHVWIERRQKASGWQKIKSERRILRIRKLAAAAFASATFGEKKFGRPGNYEAQTAFRRR